MTTDATIAAVAKPPRAARTKATPAPTSMPTSASATTSKSDTVIKLLLRAKGATPTELIAATDWQPHSVRAFLSGLRKKGRVIAREARKNGEFAYRIVTDGTTKLLPAAETSDPAEAGSAADDTAFVGVDA